MLKRRSRAHEDLQPSHRSKGLMQTKLWAQAQKGQTCSSTHPHFPLHSTWSRDSAGHLGQLHLSRDVPYHIPGMPGLEGPSEYLPNVLTVAGPSQPITSHPLVEAPSLHPVSGIRCPMSSVKVPPAYKEGPVAGSFLALQVAVKHCLKRVQYCLNHFHQMIHFSLAWR